MTNTISYTNYHNEILEFTKEYMQLKDRFENEYLITNDYGRYQFVNDDTLKKLVLGKDELIDAETKKLLKKDYFVYEGSKQAFLEESTPVLRDCKSQYISFVDGDDFVSSDYVAT